MPRTTYKLLIKLKCAYYTDYSEIITRTMLLNLTLINGVIFIKVIFYHVFLLKCKKQFFSFIVSFRKWSFSEEQQRVDKKPKTSCPLLLLYTTNIFPFVIFSRYFSLLLSRRQMYPISSLVIDEATITFSITRLNVGTHTPFNCYCFFT